MLRRPGDLRVAPAICASLGVVVALVTLGCADAAPCAWSVFTCACNALILSKRSCVVGSAP